MSQLPIESTRILDNLFQESKAYSSLEEISNLLAENKDLSNAPLLPLFACLKASGPEVVAKYLPKLSKKQRTLVLDIDLWEKDQIVPSGMYSWLQSYILAEDMDLKIEFVKREQFALFLKASFTISTFDIEDPMYPDDDNYFLTEDNQLIFEYHEDFPLVDEVKEMIRVMYSDMGVEHAYSFLFKLINDSYSQIQEDEYRIKKHRLSDYGLVDYFDALELLTPFLNENQVKNFIKKKVSATANLEKESVNQVLPEGIMKVFQEDVGPINLELEKIDNLGRLEFIQFSVIRGLNAVLSLGKGVLSSSTHMGRVSNDIKCKVKLAISYIKSIRSIEESIFNVFDFNELIKIGESLYSIERKRVKKQLAMAEFDAVGKEEFLGTVITSYLDGVFRAPCALYHPKDKSHEAVEDIVAYEKWVQKNDLVIHLLPFALTFYKNLKQLESENILNSDLYINYTVEEINFESLILSSFINYNLDLFEKKGDSKLSVTINELKDFLKKFMNGDEFVKFSSCSEVIEEYCEKFGLMEQNIDVSGYLYDLLIENFDGLDFSQLEIEEYKHVGGPIILNQDLLN